MDKGTPLLLRFGGFLGTCTLAALFASLPGALRVSHAGEMDALRAWFCLAGLVLLPTFLLVPLAARAREGLRGFVGALGLEHVAGAAMFVGTWLWFASALGLVLREKTHHRALGGVTFAIVALGVGVFLALSARRLATILATIRAARPTLGALLAASVIALSVLLLGLRVARAAPFLPQSSRAAMVDGLALLLGIAFCARKTFDGRKWLARVGPPLALAVVAVAAHALETEPSFSRVIDRGAPLHAAVLRVAGHFWR